MANPQLRVCVGSPEGPRSTVWRVWTARDSAYIQSRMMGSNVKVSLHGGGPAQWSRTDEWVREAGAKNADRHIVKWDAATPTASEAAAVFRIITPASELMSMGRPRRSKSARVTWIDEPPTGSAVTIEFYVAPIQPDRVPGAALPYDIVGALPLEPSWSFVLLSHDDPVSQTNARILESTRAGIRELARASGIALRAGRRGVGFAVGDDGVRGMIEVNPSQPAA